MPIRKAATRPGDKLLLEESCSLCRSETGGLGAAATDLLLMINTLQGKDEIFGEMHGRFVKVQRRFPLLCPEGPHGLDPKQAQLLFDAWFSGVKNEIEGLLLGVQGPTDEVSGLQRSIVDLQQQLEQHQDVRGWIQAEFKPLADAIYADDGVMGRLDSVVAMLMETRREGFDTPRRACVLPPWKFANAYGLSDHEQKPEEWVKRIQEWQDDDFKEGKGLFKKEKRLFLVCAHTHRIVPCGPNGQGYDIQQARTWFETSTRVAVFALQMMFATLGAMVAAPLAGAGAVAEAVVPAAMGQVESLLQDQLEGLTLDDRDADMVVDPEKAQLAGGAYASLRDFIYEVEKTAGLRMLKARAKAHRERRAPPSSSEFVFFAQKMAQVQRRDGDADVQWVLKGYEEEWYSKMRPAPIA